MKAYLLTFLITDTDEVGLSESIRMIEDARYPNHCLAPIILSAKEAEIGEWSDDHPLNKYDTMVGEAKRIFAKVEESEIAR